MNRPRLTIIAGANGSGKTTLTRWNSSLFQEIPLLDPDAIANTLQVTTTGLVPIAAARIVLSAASRQLGKRESFAVETTLSGQTYLRLMLDAKHRGFEIILVYIGTDSVEINLTRIRDRVLAGGHDVPEIDVRRRYNRSFANARVAIERADHAILFDNSSEDGYRLVATLSPSEHRFFEPRPTWLTRTFG